MLSPIVAIVALLLLVSLSPALPFSSPPSTIRPRALLLRSAAADPTAPSYPIEPLPLRIGHGFDIHRMSPLSKAGQPIVIAGVEVKHPPQNWTDTEGEFVEPGGRYLAELGVEAHSDGDVVFHSIVDAIFGALTLPDIGQVFQDTDPRWRGCDSSKFMDYAKEVMDR